MITYNHEPFIAQAIESALSQQTNFAFEIVVGEDCSTDRTRAILLEYQARFPDTIRLLLPERNLGMHRNLVETLQACTGQYIALLEGDDYWSTPHKLQKQADLLDRRPDCAICFHGTRMLHQDGSRPPWNYPQWHQKPIATLEDLLHRNFMQTCSVMFRRGLIQRIPDWFYQLKLADWTLHVLNAQHGAIAYIDEVMSVYRLHDSGVWSTQTRATNLLETIRVLQALDQHLGPRYHRHIQSSISICYLGLASIYDQLGDQASARASIASSLAGRPLNPGYRQAQIGMLLKLFAPRLYYPLHCAKRYVQSLGARML
jgi:glycosyltransferase involved in cell wall biosynthesis